MDEIAASIGEIKIGVDEIIQKVLVISNTMPGFSEIGKNNKVQINSINNDIKHFRI